MINNIEGAMSVFERAAIRHSEASENGNYEIANESYKELINAKEYLLQHDQMGLLIELLEHESKAVRMWSARYLLPLNEPAATDALEQIANGTGILSFGAKMTLTEWKAGTLT
jgi:hypothetical protein